MSQPATQLEAHRTALTGHCYRMLGSLTDAEDAVQETMTRAWRSLDRFDERASLRTWLYRIATNVCLDARSERTTRRRPMSEGSAGTVTDTLSERPGSYFIEPIPDELAIPSDASPAEAVMWKQSIRLAFVAALQLLPPKQRAALLLTEVLGFSVAEVASCLDSSVPAINSALQRARATLASTPQSDPPKPLSAAQQKLLERYVEAFHRYDADALAALLREDATFSMPPYTLWLRGPDSVRSWLLGRGIGCRGSRLIPTAACGSPTFAQYRLRPQGGYIAWSLTVLTLDGEHIVDWCSFLDTATLFPRFGLPLELPAQHFA